MDTNIYITRHNPIYGIRLYTSLDKPTILFEQTYTTAIRPEIAKESRAFYDTLSETIKSNIKIQKYIKCESIEDNDSFMVWWKIPISEFIQITADYC